MENKSIHKSISVVLKAMTVAIDVAVAEMSWLGSLEVQMVVPLLGIGLACAGVAMLVKE